MLVLLVAVNSSTLGWLKTTEDDAYSIELPTLLQLAFSIYLLILSFSSISLSTIETHWPITVNISALTAIATFALGTSALLPTNASSLQLPLLYPRVVYVFRLINLVLLLIATKKATTIPRGPPLYIPVKTVYSAKELTDVGADFEEENVSAVVQASVAEFLLFSFTAPILWLGRTAEFVDIKDLPVLTANLRAPGIFSQMRRAMKMNKLHGRRPGTGWHLMGKLWRVNAALFTIQGILAVFAAVASYGPAFFLQKLLSYLETDATRKDTSWGWV